MAGFEEISKMKLSELGEEKDTEKENDTEETALAETTQEEEEQEEKEAASEKEAGETKKMAEPQGRYYRIDAKITEKVMSAFMFGHNYRQPLMIIATIIGVVWPVFMVIQNNTNLWVAAVVMFLFVIALPLNTWNKARMGVRKNPVYQQTFHYMVDDWGLHLELGEDAIDVEWKRIYKTMFLKSSVVLYTGKVNAYLIPTEDMGDKKEEIISFIKEKKH